MSRIGLKPIDIPESVTVTLSDHTLRVKGPRGEDSREYRDIVEIRQEGGKIIFSRKDDLPFSRSYHGLMRSLVQNMVIGVTNGFTRALHVEGVGYRAEAKGNTLTLHVGYSHPVNYKVPEGYSVQVEGNNRVIVSGIDKQKVGQIAAEIRQVRKPEPYKGKGIRYEGEQIRRKERKTIG